MKNWMIVTNIHCKAVQNLAAAVQPWMADTIACETTLRPAYNGIFLSIDPVKPGFSIVVEEYDPATETQNIHITAQDPIHLLYAVSDFSNLYLPYARDAETSSGDGHYYFRQLFQEPLKPFQRQTAPRLKNRGLWTWGHVIYDYHRYIDNMVALKLNYLIIWNDFVPVNMQDVLDYAHENGVSVYLGFAWGWDTTMPDIRQWSAIADDVIRKYHAEYAAIPCDGIYFQTFTEHSDEVRDGIVVAEAAVHLVNKVSAALLAQKPTLQIQFGLHATSVLNRLDAFRQLDPRVSIIWEDVGAFPYHYMPHRTENFQQTRELNRHLQTLRDGGFGAVLKGVILSFIHI